LNSHALTAGPHATWRCKATTTTAQQAMREASRDNDAPTNDWEFARGHCCAA
jgi:hypothetical protein